MKVSNKVNSKPLTTKKKPSEFDLVASRSGSGGGDNRIKQRFEYIKAKLQCDKLEGGIL